MQPNTTTRSDINSGTVHRDDVPEVPPMRPTATTLNALSSPSGPSVSAASTRPVVVMLGLFACGGCRVSAITVEGDVFVWLDVITRGGRSASPLAVIDLGSAEPRLEIEAEHRCWADRPEIRWHLARETAQLYRAHSNHRDSASDRPRPTPGPGGSPEPGHRSRPAAEPPDTGSGQVVWRKRE